MEQINIIKYKPVKKEGYYKIMVSKLFGNDGTYRAALFEEFNAHNTQLVDFNLRKYQGRRELEEYVGTISKQCHLKGVYFGDGDCAGVLHYPLARYQKDNECFASMAFIQDINLPNF